MKRLAAVTICCAAILPGLAAGQSTPAAVGGVVVPTIQITKEQSGQLFAGRPAKMLIRASAGKGAPRASAMYLLDFSQANLALTEVCNDLVDEDCEPFISPDGTRFVYHLCKQARNAKKRNEDAGTSEIYVRRLEKGGLGKTLVAKGFDPRWWMHPVTRDEYVIFVSNEWDNGTDISGTTFIQKLKKGTCQPEGPTKVLIKDYAFRNGRSPSGRFICTTIPGGNIAEFADPLAVENAQIRIINEEPVRTICNGSMPQNDELGGRFIYENKGHGAVLCGVPNVKEEMTRLTAGYDLIQLQEWSTHPDYVSARLSSKKNPGTPKGIFVLQWSTKQWTRIVDHATFGHLWVAQEGAK